MGHGFRHVSFAACACTRLNDPPCIASYAPVLLFDCTSMRKTCFRTSSLRTSAPLVDWCRSDGLRPIVLPSCPLLVPNRFSLIASLFSQLHTCVSAFPATAPRLTWGKRTSSYQMGTGPWTEQSDKPSTSTIGADMAQARMYSSNDIPTSWTSMRQGSQAF